jgi:iron complex outermembrane receptor protein
MNRFLLNLLLCLQVLSLTAQTNKGITDSVFRIKEVTVSSNRLEYFSIGNKIRTVDSSLLGSYATSNLAQVLGSYSQVQINSYGLGLSNPSIRGTGTSHTAVLWNGFNLQDVLNGGVDCALLPVNFFDDIAVQYGGCSALFGSGAIGGAIHLSDRADFDKGFRSALYTGYGSFENMFGGLNLGYSNARYSGFVKSFYSEAKNDFEFNFSSDHNSRSESMKNADRKQYGILTGNRFLLGKNNTLENYIWFQDNNKNIAPTLLNFDNSSFDNQKDKFYRFTTSWKTWNERSDFTLRTYFSNYNTIWDSLHYKSVQFSNQAEYNLKINKNHLLNIGMDYTFEKGVAKNLISNAHRNRIALFTSYRFTSSDNKLQVVANIRNEMIEHIITPITFSIGLEYPIIHIFSLKGNISKNYRVPTFNDLYWFPGGNPDLKNESGFNKEYGFLFSPKFNSLTLRYEFTRFSNNVTDWILWQPSLNDKNIWTPQNVNKVWARGFENDLSVSFPADKLLIKTSLSYSYTRSTKEKSDAPGDITYRKQLIYVPVHKGLASISMRYHGYSFYYAQSFTGTRYSSKDNVNSIEPYSLGNLSVSKNLKYQQFQFNISFQVNNLWNSVYQVMPYYPMPLRNFQLNLQLNL